MIDCPEYAFELYAYYTYGRRWELYHVDPSCKGLDEARTVYADPHHRIPDPARRCIRCSGESAEFGANHGGSSPAHVLARIGRNEDDPDIDDLPELYDEYASA